MGGLRRELARHDALRDGGFLNEGCNDDNTAFSKQTG